MVYVAYNVALGDVSTFAEEVAALTARPEAELVVDLEQRTPAVFVGEPTGGSPNQYGDARSVRLSESV